MRIPLFAHDANPRVDAPLCHKSRERALAMIAAGEVRVLRDGAGREWALQFKAIVVEHTLKAQLASCIPSQLPSCVTPVAPSSSRHISTAAITDVECRASVGECETANEMVRAQQKIAAYPHVFDTRAPVARGTWA